MNCALQKQKQKQQPIRDEIKNQENKTAVKDKTAVVSHTSMRYLNCLHCEPPIQQQQQQQQQQ